MTDSLELTFALPAPPEAVFAAWTEADQILRWWTHSGVYRTATWRADVRPGGAWEIEFVDVAGDLSGALGQYLEVERPRQLVWTWRASWDPDIETTIDMTFDPAPGGTTMILRQAGFSSDSDRDDNTGAWTEVVGWLRDFLAREAAQPA